MIRASDVQHIAHLARIKLTDDELIKYREDFALILDYFDILQEVDTDNIEPMTHSAYHENIARADIPQSVDPDVISHMMQLMPAVKDGFLKVKTILLLR